MTDASRCGPWENTDFIKSEKFSKLSNNCISTMRKDGKMTPYWCFVDRKTAGSQQQLRYDSSDTGYLYYYTYAKKQCKKSCKKYDTSGSTQNECQITKRRKQCLMWKDSEIRDLGYNLYKFPPKGRNGELFLVLYSKGNG